MQLGHALDVVHSELLPEDKARIIEDYKKEGPTAMIGDGINDAPALATADIGISMGISGSALAMETGHVILMSNNIQNIPIAIQLARRTFRKLVENVIISITTKGAILALAFAGYPLIWAAVLTDVGTCLIVILNSMLLLQETPKQKGGFSRSRYGTFSMTSYVKDKSINPEEEKQCNDGCCKKVIHDVESPRVNNLRGTGPLSLSFIGESQITNLVGKQAGDNNKVCSDGCCDKVTHSAGIELDNDTCEINMIKHMEPCNNVASSGQGCSNCTQVSCKDKNFANIAESSSSSVCMDRLSEIKIE
jgi:Cd2+/Zn2+-exporting ATPase